LTRNLRTLDALQLAVALGLNGPGRLVEFVSADHAFTGDDARQKLDFSETRPVPGFLQGLEILGQGGADTITGSARADTLHGGEGVDILGGGGGGDILYGDDDAHIDVLSGGDGDDTIHGGQFDDAHGGRGDDILLLNGSGLALGLAGDDGLDCTNCFLTNLFNGGQGQDTLVLEGGDQVDHDFDMDRASLEVLDPLAALNCSGQDNEVLLGSAVLGADSTGATINGGAGDDHIQGLNGSSDLIHGDDDNDRLFGLSGNDVLFGDSGANTLDGGDGDDTINGGANDLVLGRAGFDDIEVTGVAQPGLAPAEVLGGAGDEHSRASDVSL
jgi:Ca2+-binding RTX toxin-like protein